MMDDKGTGFSVNEDEIELDLGLSIGGSTFGKPEKSKLVEKESVFSELESKPSGFESDLTFSRSSLSPTFVRNVEHESGFVDLRTKHEMQALRRQQAKRKREERQQKKGLGRARNEEYLKGGFTVADNEAGLGEGARTNERTGNTASENNEMKNVNLNLRSEQNMIHNVTSNPTVAYPVMPAQYSCPPLQYLPLTNGFAFPSVMPRWAPVAANGDNERNVFQPVAVACRSFRPFQAHPAGLNVSSGSDSKQNSSRDGGNKKAGTDGSPMCSSSVVSDYQSSSHEGGGSSDSRSHSNHSLPEQPQLSGLIADDAKGWFEQSVSSHPVGHTQGIGETTNVDEKTGPLNVAHSNPIEPKEEAISKTQTALTSKPISSTENPIPGPLKGQPPQSQTQNHDAPSLPHMPCVSTTGNGPNGKTITGFLYRYTKTEVSIICVCHGTSFSPAEFVEHAGGTNVSNPLKQITVIPSAFG